MIEQQERAIYTESSPTKGERHIAMIFYLPNLILSIFIFLLMLGLFQLIILFGKYIFEFFSILITCIVVPYIIWLVLWLYKRKNSNFIDNVGRAVLNYTLSLLFWWVIVILAFITIIWLICDAPTDEYALMCITIGIFASIIIIVPIIAVLILIISIFGIERTLQGQFFHVPLSFKYLKYKEE
ncbi:DUF4870 domain-containing protein [Staphylococcus pettenkoferi]|uniref:DUF4870 domain-containing protein n=2 Tax=Staphylococcus pettenkoferi TaxID=170573 RepID=UPI0011A90DE4